MQFLSTLQDICANIDMYIPQNIIYMTISDYKIGDYKNFSGKSYWLLIFYKDWNGKRQKLSYNFDTNNNFKKYQTELPKGYRLEKEEIDQDLVIEFITFLTNFFGKNNIDKEQLDKSLNTFTFSA